MATSRQSRSDNTNQLTFLSEELPVSPSASQASEADWMMSAVTWPSNILGWLTDYGPDGWFGRTSPASCHRMEDGTLVPFSGAWSSSGMASPTECLTLSTSEWTGLEGLSLSDDGVCSLLDILETGDVPPRYYLSVTACRGVLRRSEKRGKSLPPSLQTALEHVAQTITKPKPTT